MLELVGAASGGQAGQMFFGQPGVDPVGGVIFWTAFALWVGSEIWLQRRRPLPAGASSHDQGSMSLLIVSVWSGVGLGLCATWFLRGLAIGTGREPLFVAGLVLMGSGLTLRWWAVAALGSNFSVEVGIQPEQELIAVGPYRWVRHPSYTGSLLTIIGVGICCANWIAVAALALPFVGYGYRIHVEEQALLLRFGEAYRGYMRATKRLLPGLI